MKTLAVVGCVIILLITTGCTSPEKEPESIGRQLYVTHCSACHGMNGSGNGPAAVSLKESPRDLRRIAFREGGEFPFMKVAAHIDGRSDIPAHGLREMPVWGKQFGENLPVDEALKEEMISGNLLHLITYLESLQSYH